MPLVISKASFIASTAERDNLECLYTPLEIRISPPPPFLTWRRRIGLVLVLHLLSRITVAGASSRMSVRDPPEASASWRTGHVPSQAMVGARVFPPCIPPFRKRRGSQFGASPCNERRHVLNQYRGRSRQKKLIFPFRDCMWWGRRSSIGNSSPVPIWSSRDSLSSFYGTRLAAEVGPIPWTLDEESLVRPGGHGMIGKPIGIHMLLSL